MTDSKLHFVLKKGEDILKPSTDICPKCKLKGNTSILQHKRLTPEILGCFCEEDGCYFVTFVNFDHEVVYENNDFKVEEVTFQHGIQEMNKLPIIDHSDLDDDQLISDIRRHKVYDPLASSTPVLSRRHVKDPSSLYEQQIKDESVCFESIEKPTNEFNSEFESIQIDLESGQTMEFTISQNITIDHTKNDEFINVDDFKSTEIKEMLHGTNITTVRADSDECYSGGNPFDKHGHYLYDTAAKIEDVKLEDTSDEDVSFNTSCAKLVSFEENKDLLAVSFQTKQENAFIVRPTFKSDNEYVASFKFRPDIFPFPGHIGIGTLLNWVLEAEFDYKKILSALNIMDKENITYDKIFLVHIEEEENVLLDLAFGDNTNFPWKARDIPLSRIRKTESGAVNTVREICRRNKRPMTYEKKFEKALKCKNLHHCLRYLDWEVVADTRFWKGVVRESDLQ